MNLSELLNEYESGPQLLRNMVSGLSEDDLTAVPVPGKWSIRQVVAHLADAETVYLDRMKRVLAEDNPILPEMDPDLFAAAFSSDLRSSEDEVLLIDLVRKQMLRILRSRDPEDFQRTGVHSIDGPMTLETLLERISGHIPHHLRFIEEKLAVLRKS